MLARISEFTTIMTFSDKVLVSGTSTAAFLLSPAEVKRYSPYRALLAAAQGGWQGATFEREVSDALAGREGVFDNAPYVFRMPPQVLCRDLTAANAAQGGFLKETEVIGVLDALWPRLLTRRLGVRRITGLRGDGTIVRRAGTSTFSWLPTEATQATETADFQLRQIALAPKFGAAYVEVSRQVNTMAPALADALVLDDMSMTMAVGVDTAVLNGSGASGAPLGLLNTPNIGTFTGASVAYAGVLEAQTDILAANALSASGEVSFVCPAAVALLLAQRQGFSTTIPMWVGPLAAGSLIGCPGFSSQIVPASTLIGGDWSQMLLAEWGNSIEIRVNPWQVFPAGIISYSARVAVDVAVLQPSAFSVATSVS